VADPARSRAKAGRSGGPDSSRNEGRRKRLAAPEGLGALDRVIHERARLGIVSALAVNDSLTFNELKSLLGLTDGNLSVHARRLEEAGYVSCAKSFDHRVPRSEYRLTAEGRRALERHLEHLAAVIRWARS
jgi:DNA-binding MarR family transcriptional regulator